MQIQKSTLGQIKVLDLSRVLAGPWATQILGDLGAEIIKVESPLSGDDTRHWGPPFLQGADGQSGDSAYYSCTNRNKQVVALDIKTLRGQEKIKELAAESHILVENFQVGKLAKYGLDYETMRKLNPALVYCSITGFGQTGPYKARPGYDYLVQAMGGLMSLTGSDSHPCKVGVAVADLFSGMYAAVGILAALRHAEATGQGQQIDISLLDCQLAMLANQGATYLISGQVPTGSGTQHPVLVPYQPFETADGWLVLAIGNDRQFAKFCMVADTDWHRSVRFQSVAARSENRKALIDLMEPVLRQKSMQSWIELCNKADIPCGPINHINGILNDPYVQAREMIIPMTRPDGTICPVMGSPLKFSQTPVRYRIAPPPHPDMEK